jgi:hypothetical protein
VSLAGVYRIGHVYLFVRLLNFIKLLRINYPNGTSTLVQEMLSPHPKPPTPQFHHYVPRFLLRRWVTVTTVKTRCAHVVLCRRSSFSSSRGKKKPQILQHECMNSYDIATDTLTMGGTPIDTTFGIVNMYRDEDHATDVDHIEKAFSRLESEAARIIHKIEKAIEKGEVVLPRGEVNSLRKFLFLLCYRNDSRSRQFIEEIFDENTHNDIKDFRAEHGLKDSKAVWLLNIKHILESEHWEIGHNPKIFWPDRTDYKHELEVYQLGFFCVPHGFEFISTGSMGLFEGSEVMNPLLRLEIEARRRMLFPGSRGAAHGTIPLTRSWPLTPRLVVMLRHRFLTQEQNELAAGLRPRTQDFMQSYFHDFPRVGAAVTYNPPLSAATRRMKSGSRTEEDERLFREFSEENKLDGQIINSRLKDTLKFQISTLNEDQAARMNVLFLEHCNTMINFISPGPLRKSLKRYVDDRVIVGRVDRDVRFESLDKKLKAEEEKHVSSVTP